MTKPRILYIDDEETNCMIMELYLKKFVEIDCTLDPDEALLLIQQHDYDLVLTDFLMPTMNGIELAEKMIDLTPSISVILITAQDKDDAIQKALEINVIKDCFHKPINQTTLVFNLSTHVGIELGD